MKTNKDQNRFSVKGCLPLVIGIVIAARVINSCSSSDSKKSAESTVANNSTEAVEIERLQEEADNAKLEAAILEAILSSERENSLPRYTQQQEQSEMFWECRYCGRTMKCLPKYLGGGGPPPKFRCEGSPSGKCVWTRRRL